MPLRCRRCQCYCLIYPGHPRSIFGYLKKKQIIRYRIFYKLILSGTDIKKNLNTWNRKHLLTDGILIQELIEYCPDVKHK